MDGIFSFGIFRRFVLLPPLKHTHTEGTQNIEERGVRLSVVMLDSSEGLLC